VKGYNFSKVAPWTKSTIESMIIKSKILFNIKAVKGLIFKIYKEAQKIRKKIQRSKRP